MPEIVYNKMFTGGCLLIILFENIGLIRQNYEPLPGFRMVHIEDFVKNFNMLSSYLELVRGDDDAAG